ncbi:MAG: polysaccharide deacetylase family protein [Proteobacteria bacterium]|nr:polysaccharide deacetylase family protein [Pseudomonadota bacterium]
MRGFKYLVLCILIQNYIVPAEILADSFGVILQYHHVSDDTPRSTSIQPTQFVAHLQWLRENRFHVWPLPDLLDSILKNKPVPDRTVAITFDDGYYSIYDVAFPILKKFGLPFTIFISTQAVDNRHKTHLTWNQIREMSGEGATIANHTTSHAYLIRRLPLESEDNWSKRVTEEILTAGNRITTETGQRYKFLAYPYGESSQNLRMLIKKLGYIALGQQSGPVSGLDDPQNLPRFPLSGIYSGISTFKDKMLSLPFSRHKVEIVANLFQGALKHDAPVPILRIFPTKGMGSLRNLNCFVSGQGRAEIQRYKGNFEVQALSPLLLGRSRYNCTEKSQNAGRYYWFSQSWIRLGKNNRWVHH